MKHFRDRLTYANVMATIAVFVALGGTSYAVASLPKNSVGTKQIRNSSIRASDLRKDSVTSSELKQRSVRLEDVSLAARAALRGAAGPAGPQGPPGPPVAPLTAAVSAGGAMVRSTAAAPVADHQSGSGLYEVVFNRDLRGCFAVATVSTFAPPGVTEAGQISTETSDRGVWVRTRNSSGAVADLPFHLMVVC